MGVRLQVDPQLCQGHGRCYALAPDLIGPDEIGNAKLVGTGQVPPGLEDEAERAVDNCPEWALSLIEES